MMSFMVTTLLVDIVAVDGVDVVLHDSITRVFGDSRSDVAEIMDDAGLIVEKFVRDKAAAIRDVKMSIVHPKEAFVWWAHLLKK